MKFNTTVDVSLSVKEIAEQIAGENSSLQADFLNALFVALDERCDSPGAVDMQLSWIADHLIPSAAEGMERLHNFWNRGTNGE